MRCQDRQPVGVDDHRQIGVEGEPQRGGTGLVGAQPWADDPGLHPACRRDTGRGDHLRPVVDDLRGGGSGIAHHARRGGDGRAGAQDGCAGVGRRTGQHTGHALGVLVIVGARYGPACGDVDGLQSAHIGLRQVEPDVYEFDPAALAKGVNEFEPAERDGHRGVHVGTVGGSGGHVDAAGDVDGDDRDASLVDMGEHLGGGGP